MTGNDAAPATERAAFGVRAGANKFGFVKCPFCGDRGTELLDEATGTRVRFFMFNDEASAREHRISGMCQPCQDGVFH